MKFISFIILVFFFNNNALAKFSMDYVDYTDNVYSNSKKTELGDEIELEMSMKYDFNESSAVKFRFQTRPEDNREVNKTDRFELGLSHKLDSLDLYLDLEILTNDGSTGGTALSFDLDSDYTFIKWTSSEKLSVSFFPFNFDGEVGDEFSTWDVTRIFHIEGAEPGDTINGTQGSKSIVSKTIPGIVLDYKVNDNFDAYIGFGVASYVYPVDSDFDITATKSITRLKRKEDFGYKFGMSYKADKGFHSLNYVGHTDAKETGALHKEAASFYSLNKIFGLVLEAEVTYAKAGDAPWEVDGDWYAQTTPLFAPVYSNYNGTALQDWVGKSDMAYGIKVGIEYDSMIPYLFYRYHGEHFVYNAGESAHELRTFDLDSSHGGLNRVGMGSFFLYGKNLVINPELEYLTSENPVFANSSDVRKDRYYGTYKKSDMKITLNVNYDFNGSSIFEL